MRTWLVECDMPIFADPSEEELDAAHGADQCLIRCALAMQIGGVPI